MKILQRIGVILAILIAFLVVAGWYLLGSEDVPETTAYNLDLDDLRTLGDRYPGEKPVGVRFSTIAIGSLPRGIILAGEGFDLVEMPRAVFQVMFPDQSYVLIDSAYDRALHEVAFASEPYYDDAWDDLVIAMEGASDIVVTHEHSDHLGGIANHLRPESIASNLRLTEEQMANPTPLDAPLPEALSGRIELLRYTDALAIAPGVVLKKAPGHTPGSQLVYVELEDGKELLFVGDVVWNLDAITQLKYRPRLVTDLVIGEDRSAVLDQIRALRNLHDEGRSAIVVAHDARTFESAGLEEGLSLPTN